MIRKDFISKGATLVPLACSSVSGLLAEEKTESYLQISKQAKALNTGKSLSVLYPEGCKGNLLPVINLFTNLTGIPVILEEAPRDEINTYILLGNMKKSSRFDVVLPSTFGLPDLIETNAISELSEYVKKYEPDHIRINLYSVANQYKKKFYAYLADGDVSLMYYNTNFLNSMVNKKRYEEEHGQNLRVPQTWDELDQQIRFFHHPQKGKYGGCLFRNSIHITGEWWMRFHAKGFYPFSKDLKPQVDNEAGIKALEEMIQITPFLHPNVMKDDVMENIKNFEKGHSYCNLGWGGAQKYYVRQKSPLLNSLTYALPCGLVDKSRVHSFSYFNWGTSYAVSNKSQQKELAYLFILFASSPLPSTLSIREVSGHFDPYRIEHYADTLIQNAYGKKFLTTHKRGLTNCIPDLYLHGQSEYMNSLRINIDLALHNKLKPHQAMKVIASEWEKITEANGRASQIEQWLTIKSHYPQQLQKLLK